MENFHIAQVREGLEHFECRFEIKIQLKNQRSLYSFFMSFPPPPLHSPQTRINSNYVVFELTSAAACCLNFLPAQS